ncbi:hypothetical protein RFM99_30675, partial [Mesorhizobium sp. VK4C]|uniref:hypothetical protein n=1 Tax=Mesorhizobium captivum TaxID=3072319 RepID=UPI002A24D68A
PVRSSNPRIHHPQIVRGAVNHDKSSAATDFFNSLLKRVAIFQIRPVRFRLLPPDVHLGLNDTVRSPASRTRSTNTSLTNTGDARIGSLPSTTANS